MTYWEDSEVCRAETGDSTQTQAIVVAGAEAELEKGIALLPETKGGLRTIHLYGAPLTRISVVYQAYVAVQEPDIKAFM